MSDKFDTSDPEMLALRNEYLETVLEELVGVEQALFDTQKTGKVSVLSDSVAGTVHSVKGSAGSFGLPLITESCHHIEDIMLGMSETEDQKLKAEKLDHLLNALEGMRSFIALEASAATLDPKQYARKRSDLNVSLKTLLKKQFKKTSNLAGTKVLFIDYSKTAYLLFAHKCKEQKLEFDLDFTADGVDGIAKCLEKSYDYVICGNNINRLNGKAIISAIQHQFGKTKPVTAYISNAKDASKDFSPTVILQRSNLIGTVLMELVQEQAVDNNKKAS